MKKSDKNEMTPSTTFEWEFFRTLGAGASEWLKIDKTNDGHYIIEESGYVGSIDDLRHGAHLASSSRTYTKEQFIEWAKDFPPHWINDNCSIGYNRFKKYVFANEGISL